MNIWEKSNTCNNYPYSPHYKMLCYKLAVQSVILWMIYVVLIINFSSELQPVYALVVKIYSPRLERTVTLESSYPTSVLTESLEPAASVCVSLEKTLTGFTLKAEQSDSTRRFRRPWIER